MVLAKNSARSRIESPRPPPPIVLETLRFFNLRRTLGHRVRSRYPVVATSAPSRIPHVLHAMNRNPHIKMMSNQLSVYRFLYTSYSIYRVKRSLQRSIRIEHATFHTNNVPIGDRSALDKEYISMDCIKISHVNRSRGWSAQRAGVPSAGEAHVQKELRQ